MGFEIIKLRIKDTFMQNWDSTINSSNRLSQYCLFKNDFQMDAYLSYYIDIRYQVILAKLRLYSHNLSVETGRYDNI